MGVRTHEATPPRRVRPAGPGLGPTLLVAAVAVLLLLANGRPIGAGQASGPAAAVLRWALGLFGSGLALDPTAEALVGKVLSTLFAGVAAGALFAAVATRHPLADARWSGLLLAVGTTLAAAAQSWSGEAPTTAAVALAIWLLARAEAGQEPAVAGQAGLFLGLAVVLQPSTAALAAVLLVAALVRWRSAGLRLLAWAAPGAALAFLAGLAPSAGAAGDVAGIPALLVSPAKGAFVFAPVALVAVAGTLRALRPVDRRYWDRPSPGRYLPAACGLAAVAHFAAVAVAGGWAGGIFWGPRLLAPAWPLLLLFLPEGLALLGTAGVLLALLSCAVQAMGALAYDGRWDRLHRAPGGELAAAWSIRESPIVFQARERVVRLGLPAQQGGRLVVREHAIAPSGPSGSFVSFAREPPAPTGADETMTAFHLDGGARVAYGRLELRSAEDGLAFRVREGTLPRRLEIRLVGSGEGTLGVGEADLFTETRWRERAVKGHFRLRLPYYFPDSGGRDVVVRLRAGGPLAIDSLSLVPPGEPDNVLRLP